MRVASVVVGDKIPQQLPILWFLLSFHVFFQNGPWTLCVGVGLQLYLGVGGAQLHKAVFCLVKMVLFEHFIFDYTVFTSFLPHLAPPIGPDYIHAHIYCM